MFTLHVVQALYGDCLLLSYGETAGEMQHMLVDGGPTPAYRKHLRPLLAALAARGERVATAVLTHTDNDHVAGLVELFADLHGEQVQGRPPLIPVDGMWLNSFVFDATFAPSMAHIMLPSLPAPARAAGGQPAPEPAHGVAEGIDLRQLLALLAIPVNSGFAGELVSVDSAPLRLEMQGLQLTLVGPTKSNLARMRTAWQAWLRRHRPPEGAPEGAPALVDLDQKVAPDQSIPNRSSIMFVAEYGGRRILLTGDGRGSDVVRGLERAGLLPKGGTLHVDVLKLPHHGSARNASRKFFSQVTADAYVISADGTNGNPDLPTLAWLVQAVKEQGRQVCIYATNLTPTLEELQREFAPERYGYSLKVLDADHHALAVEIG